MTPSADMPSPAALPRLGLDPLFYPRSIVLIGEATTEAVADSVWKSLTANFIHGTMKRLNFGDRTVDAEFPEGTDLAIVVATPEHQPAITRLCSSKGTRVAALLSADYREGSAPARVAAASVEPTVDAMRILGPQSFGFIVPHHELNITPLLPMPRPGSIAFISQSGGLCNAVLDWSFRTSLGFSAIVSSGLMADIDWHDLITYFGDDPHTKSIVVYLESLHDARSFLSAAKEVALAKPIILLKAGHTAGGAAAAANHSHGDGRTDRLLDAALQRVGVLRVRSIAELFYMANILATQPLPKGPRLSIMTNAIGPAILATDSLVESNSELADVSPESTEQLQQLLPATSCCGNPFDLLGDATPELYGNVARVLAKDPANNGLLVIMTPQTITRSTDIARQIVHATTKIGKPVLASWMGGDRVSEGQNILFEAGIPAFPYPDTPARLFALMWQQARNLDAIYETPSAIPDPEDETLDPGSVATMLEGVRAEGRQELTEWEAMAVLKGYAIPVVQVLPAGNEDEAVTCAGITGYPVAVKLLSFSHELKNLVYGVRLNLRSEQDVRDGFRSIQQSVREIGQEDKFLGVTVQQMVHRKGLDLVVGSAIDAQFGPYIYFGTGGRISDILKDHALGLPPLTSTLAQRMIEKTRVWKAVQAQVQDPDFLLQLQAILVRLGQLIVQHPSIKELEINPLLSTSQSIAALDARIILHPPATLPSELPRPAIRPYPSQYSWRETVRDGFTVVIRPVRPDDEPLIVEFHKKLSEETIYRRYFFQQKLTRRTSHERLRRTCFLDFDREIALAAVAITSAEGKVITAVGRIARTRPGNAAEIALVVADPYQGRGIGTSILRHLVDIARIEGIELLEGTMLPGNIHMQHLFTRLGFDVDTSSRETVTAKLKL